MSTPPTQPGESTSTAFLPTLSPSPILHPRSLSNSNVNGSSVMPNGYQPSYSPSSSSKSHPLTGGHPANGSPSKVSSFSLNGSSDNPYGSTTASSLVFPTTPTSGSSLSLNSPEPEKYAFSISGGLGKRVKDVDGDVGQTGKRKQKRKVSAAVIVPIWIALSSGVIVYNKYLYSTAGFPYPIFITSFHLGCAALGTRVLRRTTSLMDGLDGLDMNWDRYIRNIIPIGVLFSGSLILSNTAYLTLSVSFIQMLKAFTPVSILLISAAFRIQVLNARLVGIVVLISTGCCLAAIGELHFEKFGFICQSLAVVFEASRLVMIQLLLQGLKMDPLCSLHYYAPVCSIINACFLPFTEGMAPFLAIPRVGFFIMFTNAMNAFLLNVAAVFLIGAAGGLVLTLAGVFKDILLISSSVIFFGSVITPIQVVGYGIALTGLVLFKTSGK